MSTMSSNTDVVKDFATPVRAPPPSSTDGIEEKKDMSPKETATDTSKAKPATVTPTESALREEGSLKKKGPAESPLQLVASHVESPEDKHVRFDKEMKKLEENVESLADSPDSTNSQRGLVSRRGGRCASPGRIVGKPSSTKESTVLEFKAYRSPPRRKDENDTVPSLCSTNSHDKEKSATEEASSTAGNDNLKVEKEETETSNSNEGGPKPASISCDSSMNQSSPLTSHEADQSQENKTKKVKTEDSRKATTPPRKNNVTFSPVPPPRIFAAPIHTPTKSPTGGQFRGQFQSLPTLDDDALKSPVGIFLSPHPPTPSYRSLQESEYFDKSGDADKAAKKTKCEEKQPADAKSAAKSPKAPKSPRTPKRDPERDRFVATPTNFAMDYGRYPNSASSNSSNVLAWLQSPTANGLFSPGGFGSIMNTPSQRNTPRGGIGPRTPRTPTVSTSFFFSDVAGLPQSGDHLSPKPGGEGGKRPGSGRGYSNIICISPLASSKTKNGANQQANTPTMTINYKEMFASPAERRRDLALLGNSPAKGTKPRGVPASASRDPSLDAVHMAERDLMEDEDLSVLLQLASNTPRSTGDRPVAVSTSDGTHVFRSPNGRSNSHSGNEKLPSLQLPIIGGRESEGNGTRLSRKTHSRDHGDGGDDFHRPLGMLSNGSGSTKDAYHGKAKKGTSEAKDSGDKRKDSTKSENLKKAGKMGALHPGSHNPYSIPPHPYAHPDAPYYPPMPPGMPHGGSMRVVVGAPPPSRSSKSSGSPHGTPSPRGSRPYPMGPGDPNYPPPPYPPPPGHYAHHPGVPPPHMHPHYSHYPPPHHPPPRPHMPMYGAQHPLSKSKPPKKTPKPTKPGTKRPAPVSAQKTSSAKKTKKSSPSSAAPKKKNKSPQLTERSERQKAAAAIQAVNAASGGKNDKAAALAAAILRGVTMRPSGKWQAQLYFAGKSRYIGVFDTREKAALAYEIAREKLKSEKSSAEGGTLSPMATEAAVNAARKAAFEGVNERDPRLASK